MTIREIIYSVLNQTKKLQVLNYIYDSCMVLVIITSIIPLMFYGHHPIFYTTDRVCVIIFIIDYILRWITADMVAPNKKFAFLKYPITPLAIVDLLSILPGLNITHKAFKAMRVVRFFKIVRVLKLIKYSRKIKMLLRVLQKEQQILTSVFILAVFYIFFTALLVFNVEPQINAVTGKSTFNTFFEALYWATITLTTVGYGDIVPVTDLGRLVSMLSSLFGLAIIALPSGIITASYLEELRRNKSNPDTQSVSHNPIKRIMRKNKRNLKKPIAEIVDKTSETTPPPAGNSTDNSAVNTGNKPVK